ncbi:hypothetical protein, partial [Variovorax sp. KK3]|uniref:hypothetical protein n=1 Tax=Variovorax sp. KK3 TaxID=1855728 RepID=UPI001C4DE086
FEEPANFFEVFLKQPSQTYLIPLTTPHKTSNHADPRESTSAAVLSGAFDYDTDFNDPAKLKACLIQLFLRHSCEALQTCRFKQSPRV